MESRVVIGAFGSHLPPEQTVGAEADVTVRSIRVRWKFQLIGLKFERRLPENGRFCRQCFGPSSVRGLLVQGGRRGSNNPIRPVGTREQRSYPSWQIECMLDA